jgi:hypothetical protein
MTDDRESFREVVNGDALEGAALWVRLNGSTVACTYVRPMNAKPHRCVIAMKYEKRGKSRVKFATVSTRKVTFA